LLCRHGLYSSHLVGWRKAQQAGALAGLSGLPRPVKRPPSRALGHRQAADAVIDSALTELEPELGIVRACGLLGRSRATRYRKLKPAVERTQQPRASPPNALTAAEREQVLGVLRCPEHGDLAVAQVWARELDAGRYYCSISSMYPILRATGEVRERRSQATHPAKVKPELVAHGPNQVWS